MGYEETLAALGDLWIGGREEAERAEAEARERFAAVEARVDELRAEIRTAEDGISAARDEMGGMASAFAEAQLSGDDAEALALQGRHAELTRMVETLNQDRERAAFALGEVCGAASPADHLNTMRARRDREIEEARHAHLWRVRRQFEELREALEDARTAAIGERTKNDRLLHEASLAQRERPESTTPPERRANRAEERREFEENRRKVEAAREREREEARTAYEERARKMGLPLERLRA